MIIKSIIASLDNLPLLKKQIPILRREPIDEIIIVNNGSVDGTREWLNSLEGEDREGLVIVHHDKNMGASISRNSGLDAAGEFDYVLCLDGGILPLHNGVNVMLDYLQRHPEVDIVSPEIATCFTTDPEEAHRRLVEIDESTCFAQRALSSTAYALCTRRAWDGLRFCEDGPFGMAGWAVEDNEMQYQWNKAGIIHHDFSGTKLYRRQSGSFQRLFQETGIWPNQYGSVYEQRCVLVCQMHPEMVDLLWLSTNIQVSAVLLGWNEYPDLAKTIKAIHEDLKDIPHEIIFVDNGSTDDTKWWLDTFEYRWHHNQEVVRDGHTDEIIRLAEHPELESIWTGNVIRVDMGENRGTGEGYTAGLERAKGKYIFLNDADCIPHPGSVLGLYNYLEEHHDLDFVAANPWFEDQDVSFDGDYNNNERWPLGNYAYGFSMFKREILDAGVRHPVTGPFKGPGSGYDDVEFANQMYMAGFNGWVINVTPYDHKRSDLRGADGRNIWERKAWLNTRWRPQQEYRPMYNNVMPPEKHVRRVAVIGRGCDNLSDISSELTDNLNDVCYAECFDLLDHVQLRGNDREVAPIEGEWDNYIFIAGGNWDRWECPEWAHPSIYWAIDMYYPDGKHMWPQAEPIIQLERAEKMDHVFCVHQSAVEFYEANGISAKRLSGCADPKHEYPIDKPRNLDWTALWHHAPGIRRETVDALREVYPNGFCIFKFLMEWTKWINEGKCTLNISRLGELNWRPYEVFATRIPLITSRVDEIGEFFTEGEHYLGTDSIDETIQQVTWVLENLDEAQEMADRVYDLVLDRHTYYHRILEMFESIGE